LKAERTCEGMCIYIRRIVLIMAFFMWSIECSAIISEQSREKFLQAEKMIESGNDEKFSLLSKELSGYPLHFYLEYQWLVKHLDQEPKVRQFLKSNEAPLYTRKLRRKWLDYLYKNKQWKAYEGNYRSSKNKQKQCRYQWARYQLNKQDKALQATKDIWLTGRSLPKDCDELLVKFSESPLLTQKLIWQRFKLAVRARQVGLASYLQKKIVDSLVKADANKWILLLKNPALISGKEFLNTVSVGEQSKMLVYAVRRLVGRDMSAAIKVWERENQTKKVKLSQKQINKIERAIALQLAFSKSNKAYQYFSKLKQTDKVIRAWEVRSALIGGDWKLVQKSLNKLSKDEQAEGRWRYWQAKTFLETNQLEQALKIFNSLAKERSYYGFLAADYILKDYVLADSPIKVADTEIKQLLMSKGFVVINEFRAVNQEDKAQQYWWEVVRGFKRSKLLVAAKIAEQWQWHKHAIMAVAQAKHWDDIELRFPIDYVDKIKQNAQLQGVDSALIYGLIRRESMFDEEANSPVGALGLMQVMPATGKQIAKEITFPWKSKNDLLKASTNLRFGTYYYKQMIDKFSGNFALAVAAYNAGPTGVQRWIKIDRVYAADLWIETIPYKETREYVAAVLTYALIYQRRLGTGKNLMADFMRDIQAPKS